MIYAVQMPFASTILRHILARLRSPKMALKSNARRIGVDGSVLLRFCHSSSVRTPCWPSRPSLGRPKPRRKAPNPLLPAALGTRNASCRPGAPSPNHRSKPKTHSLAFSKSKFRSFASFGLHRATFSEPLASILRAPTTRYDPQTPTKSIEIL